MFESSFFLTVYLLDNNFLKLALKILYAKVIEIAQGGLFQFFIEVIFSHSVISLS